MKNKKIKALTEGAIMLALATVLSFLKLFELPQGGAVCIGMLPVFIYCARWGWKDGFKLSFAYGILQLLLDGAYAWGPTSMLLDYVLAFGVLGFAGFFKNKKGGVFIGAIVASAARFIMHFISGITIYRIYAPTEVFNMLLVNPYIYSAVYNGGFMAIDLAICLIILAVLNKTLTPYYKGANIN